MKQLKQKSLANFKCEGLPMAKKSRILRIFWSLQENLLWSVAFLTLGTSCGPTSTQFYGETGTEQIPPPVIKPPVSEDAKPLDVEVVEESPKEIVVLPPSLPAPPPPPPPVIQAPKVEEPPKDPDLNTKKPLRQVTWLWQCQNSNSPAPQPQNPPPSKPKEDDTLTINGAGQHVLDRDVSQGTDVTLAGDICAPEIQPRDLLFMIDTSISTNDSDPLVNNTCGRMTAIDTIIKSLSVGDNQMGLVTFSSNVNVFTPQFYKKPADLFASVAPQGNPQDILCNDDGTTNYVAPLVKASELFSLGRPQATKELFIISDGEPNNGEEGINEANLLKTTGVTIAGKNYPVTIATIMLNGEDTVLEQFIASKDVNGKPMHVFAAQSSQLAKALSDLAENPIVKASMKYKSKGQSQFTEVELLTSADKKTFQLPPVKFTFQAMKDGIEVVYKYTNKRGQTSEFSGTITIAPTNAPVPSPRP